MTAAPPRVARALLAAAGFALAVLAPASASAAWFQGYVVDYYSSPGWQGGDKDANCPNGSLPKADWVALLHTPWRNDAEVQKMAANAGINFQTPLANRGPKRGQNVHRDPTLSRDPMIPPVVGNIGYGMDLDHNARTGFVSPDGKARGLDNQVYRAVGCLEAFRGGGRRSKAPRPAETFDNQGMMDGAYTVLIMLSGEGSDPRNDAKVRVGFYVAKEPLAKDGLGGVARDYSYRIDPDPRFMTVFDAASKNGVVTPVKPLERFKIREYATRPNFPQDMILEAPQVRLTLNGDGTLHTELGGYRDWRFLYMGLASAGSPSELAGGFETPGVWYSWQRMADWKPKGAKGPNTHISSFFTLDAVPAYLITPESQEVVKRAEVFTGVSQAAQKSPQALAAQMLASGEDPGFRLVGGAAQWPPRPVADPPVPARGDGLFWAKLLVDPRGIQAAYAAAIGDETKRMEAATPPAQAQASLK
ncbi:hypothetical protein BH11PSE2_BH11PSE2_22570 [soil metagenome]